MKKKILNIDGMTCSACSGGLEKYLKKQEGIEYVSVNLVMAQAYIEYDENILRDSDIDRLIEEAGFKSLGDEISDESRKNSLKSICVFSALAVVLMFLSMGKMMNFSVGFISNAKCFATLQFLITTLFIVWGYDIIKSGMKNIRHLMPNMDSLVGIGVAVNYLYSFYNTTQIYKGNFELSKELYFEASAMIILFVKIGRYIDRTNKAKAVDSIKNLVKITPKTGIVLKDGVETEVAIDNIKKGDIIVSRPGERISVDGFVLNGETHTDESFLTGESIPVKKQKGSKVLAGSINYEGYIEYIAEDIGKKSSISQIVNLVVKAANSKAPISRVADKISLFFVPIIFLVAIITFLLNWNFDESLGTCIDRFVTVLIVACPCSFGLATPLAMVVAIGTASKNGIVIKSGESIEALNKIDTVVFDKTGTVTKGEMEIVDCKFLTEKEENLRILQSLESKSNHPLAKGICKKITESANLEKVTDFEEMPGFGVKGKIQGITFFAGNRKLFELLGIKNKFENEEKIFSNEGESVVYFGSELGMLGLVGLKDVVKPTTKNMISELKTLKKRMIMLSGDNYRTSKSMANEIGVEELYSDVSPEEKLEKIKIFNKNNNVLMIGDGINDSPALRSATIGVSVSNGTDISSDSSDIIMLSDDLKKIPYLFKLGKKTLHIVKENLFWALFYNCIMIPLAMGALPFSITPMRAAFAMTISSLTVVINSLRLRNI